MTSEKAPERMKISHSMTLGVTFEKTADLNGFFHDVVYVRADVADAMVAVKPLTWTRADLTCWGEYADAGLVRYRMTWTYRNHPEVWFVMKCEIDGRVLYEGGDEEAAKAAAQADVERRILSALQSTSDARAALAEAELKAWEAGRDAAKALIQKELDDYIYECGMYDSTTGVTEYPGTGEEWVQDQQERIDAIAALKKEPGA